VWWLLKVVPDNELIRNVNRTGWVGGTGCRPRISAATLKLLIAVHDGAFAAPSLTSVSRVFQVKNRGPVKCTPLRWKKEWLKRPVFRRFDGSIISASASAGVAEHTRSGASGSQEDGKDWKDQLLKIQPIQ
jgi:hypothetical protein